MWLSLGPLFLTLASCVGRALELLDLVRLPFRQFVNQIHDCLLSCNANLYKLHHVNDFKPYDRR